MPATTYSPTHFRVQYHRPSGLVYNGHSCLPAPDWLDSAIKLRQESFLSKGEANEKGKGNAHSCADRSVRATQFKRKGPRSFLNVPFILCRQRPTLPHTFACSK